MRLALAIVAAAALATSANASVTVVNGSFEDGAPISGGSDLLGPGSTAITGWTVLSNSVDYADDSLWNAASGSRSVELSGFSAGGLLQSIGGFTPGVTYRVSFSLSANPFGPDRDYTALVSATGGAERSFSYVATAANTPTNMLWQRYAYDFTASNAIQDLQFRSVDGEGSAIFGVILDDVSVSVVPEPASWMMLIAGFGLIGTAVRRKRTIAFAA